MLVLILLYMTSLLGQGVCSDTGKIVLYVTKSGTVTDHSTGDAAARVEYKDLMDQTGWSFLTVTTNSSLSDEEQATAAGIGEGFVSALRILQTWNNTMSGYCVKSSDYCDKLKVYMDSNHKWISSMIHENKEVSAYWYHVNLVMLQIQGMYEGFNMVYPNVLTLHDIYLLNFNLDLIDMEDALRTDEIGFNRHRYGLGWREDQIAREKERMFEKVLGSGHCTALVKWTGDDLLVSHVTWNSYSAMVRSVKSYDFSFKSGPGSDSVMAGKKQVFTGYPGYVFSGDDFTLISSGLAAQETTIANLNGALWKYVKPEGSVPEFIRGVVANRLATDGQSWCKVVEKFNSGTYTNQWMIVDYNLFTPNTPSLKPGTLYVLEQLPGMTVYKDKTNLLNKQQYWPSYNLPYFPEIFNMSGTQRLVDKFGDVFSYDRNPRALIFRRDVDKVTDMDSLYKMMRYNDYQHDPLAKCDCEPPYSAVNAISARSDLNPENGTYILPLFGSIPSGGIDYKGTNYSLMKKLGMRIAAGPTWEQQPPFRWSTSYWPDISHEGMADLQQFDEVSVIFEDDKTFF